ncbi:MAG: nucleotidyltransferase family protein [Betaproteobacteria bacterium]
MRIVGVLLAAGSGSRFGGDKLLHPIAQRPHPDLLPRADEDPGEGVSPSQPRSPSGNVPMGVIACRHLVDALPDTIAVVRSTDVALGALLRSAGARVIECADAASGMGHSLACAINASRDADGWVVALADMPWLQMATIAALANALRDGAPMVAPACGGRRGNPVGFSSAYADALANLQGDRGARDVVERAGAALRLIEVDDAGVLRDIDRAADIGADDRRA